MCILYLRSIHDHETSNLFTTDLCRGFSLRAHRSHHSNAFFARVGGVSNAEMNKLELELLGVLDFAVAVDHRTYDRYREHLEKEMRRDHHAGRLCLPGALPKPTWAAAAPTAIKPLPPLAEEDPAEIADGDGEEHGRKPPPNGVRAAGEGHGRKLPNGVAPGAKTLRELCALDYY